MGLDITAYRKLTPEVGAPAQDDWSDDDWDRYYTPGGSLKWSEQAQGVRDGRRWWRGRFPLSAPNRPPQRRPAHMARIVHCWADGPRTTDDVGTTCMLEDGHEGPHEWTRDDQISIRFAPVVTPADS